MEILWQNQIEYEYDESEHMNQEDLELELEGYATALHFANKRIAELEAESRGLRYALKLREEESAFSDDYVAELEACQCAWATGEPKEACDMVARLNAEVAALKSALRAQALLTMYYNGHGSDDMKPAVNMGFTYRWQQYLCSEAQPFFGVPEETKDEQNKSQES